MKANVNFNDDGEPYGLTVSEQYGHEVSFDMKGSTAVAVSVTPAEGGAYAYLDRVSKFMEFAKTLPFVQAVELNGDGE